MWRILANAIPARKKDIEDVLKIIDVDLLDLIIIFNYFYLLSLIL